MAKIFPSNDVNIRCGIEREEYLKILLDPSVSGIFWDTSKDEVRIKMKSRTDSLTLQEYRDERTVNEFMEQIEGETHAT
jgi:hypothetical protein